MVLTVILGRQDAVMYCQVHLSLKPMLYDHCEHTAWVGESKRHLAQLQRIPTFVSQGRQIPKVELSGSCETRARPANLFGRTSLLSLAYIPEDPSVASVTAETSQKQLFKLGRISGKKETNKILQIPHSYFVNKWQKSLSCF